MILTFPLRRDRQFSLEMKLELQPFYFDFSNKASTTPDNINQILSALAAVDHVRMVRLIGQEIIELDDFNFTLNATVSIYSEHAILSWAINEPGVNPSNTNQFGGISSTLSILFAELEPVMIGTVRHHLPALQEAAKQSIRDEAARRARIMAGNAEAILTYLGEVFDYVVL